MIIFKRVPHIRDWLHARKADKKVTGFVPTMGALHKGHLSLAERSISECGSTVVSVFVNPRQFNDPEDLKKYPRPVEADLKMLHDLGVDAVFLPDVDDMYPPGDTGKINFDPGPAAMVMEGKFRPGHFEGMAEVVHRLLSIVEPERLYMGQKDFQQLTIVRKMISDLHLPVLLEMCPIVRESNGLAMSSRNERLSRAARNDAGIIYQTLTDAQQLYEENEPISSIKDKALSSLTRNGFQPEYFEIVDGVTLMDIHSNDESQYVVACCAIRVEGVRLIDNAIWTRPE